jgi:2-polyprenyl-3-methyl-5-hydroxy-6-metoxy-1,4-benzoquinol methylase
MSLEREEQIKATINTYNLTALEYERNAADLHPSELAQVLINNIPIGGSILDLGCADGRDAKIFSERGYNVTGIDLSTKLLEIARVKAPLAQFKQMDMRNLDFSSESFDGIWAVASFLHLPRGDISTVLKKCYEVLKPNGIIYVGVKQGIGEKFEPDLRYNPKALKFYTYFQESELTKAMQEIGFKIFYNQTKDRDEEYLKIKEVRIFGRKK